MTTTSARLGPGPGGLGVSDDPADPPELLPPLRERTVPQLWRRAVETNPHGVFLVCEDTEFTYADADGLVDATAAMLRSGGVRHGDHVAILLDNRAQYVWLLLAIGQIGAVGVPIHAEAKGAMLAHFFRSTDCSYAVLDATRVAEVGEVLTGPRPACVWVLGDPPAGAEPLPQVGLVQVPYAVTPPVAPDLVDLTDPGTADRPDQVESAVRVPAFKDTYLLMFTSGTSGPSKAAVVSQAQPITHALKIAESCGWTRTERFYTCLPLSHANAQCHTMLPAIGLAATMVLDRRFSVSRFWGRVAEQRCTAISLLGSMLQLLSKKEPSQAEWDNAVSTVLVVPFPRNVAELDRRYDARFATLYGLTECAPVSISRPGEGYDRALGMAGRVLRDHNDVRIVDADDIAVPVGETGEIVVRRHDPFVTVQRYYGREQDTWDDFRNLWFHTGDFGYLDDEDYLYFVGRKSDSLRRRGENVSISELESELQAFAGVLEAAVVPVPSDLGEMSEDDIAVFVTVAPGSGLTPQDISELAAERISRYMRPRYVRIVAELPKTPTAKIRKDVLRTTARDGMSLFYDVDGQRAR